MYGRQGATFGTQHRTLRGGNQRAEPDRRFAAACSAG